MTHKNDNASGLPVSFCEYLKHALDIDVFIETGTGLGRTTNLVKDMFEHIYTIEADNERFSHCVERFGEYNNVTCFHGESPGALNVVLKKFVGIRKIIFLDAHCFFREQINANVCPLIAEIYLIDADDIIIIDDLWAFSSLGSRQGYPELSQIMYHLKDHCKNPYIFIMGKSIVAVPRKFKKVAQDFVDTGID